MPIGYVNGVATDGAGNVYFTDPLEHMVLEVSPSGILTVVAGNGIAAYSGDGGPATSAAIAAFGSPAQYVGAPFEDSLGGIALDKQGNIYFGDGHYVRRVGTDGTISTVAGGGPQSPGDGGPATQAALGIVNGLAFDAAVSFSGLSPGFAGLYQIDATVPSGLAAGNQVPVIVNIGGASSPAVTIAVK